MKSNAPDVATPTIEASGRVTHLRSQVPAGVLALAGDPLRLSWRLDAIDAGSSQSAYEIQVAHDRACAEVVATSGVVESPDHVSVPAPGEPFESREVRYARVRARAAERWTPWSETLRVEAALLKAGDWRARAITLPDDPGAVVQSPAPLVRREFSLPGTVRSARLYATALGLCRITINGTVVSPDQLAPGWTPYDRRVLADAYDVTDLVVRGANAIAGAIGDGWFRGRLGWDPGGDRLHYGSQVGLVAQLEVELEDGSLHLVCTDESWRASTGEIRQADLYDGALIDYRNRNDGWELPGYDDRTWLPAAVVPFNPAIVEPRSAPPVRVVAMLPAQRRVTENGLVLDGGQNISGWVRLRVRGHAGDVVQVQHAEVLEPGGALHLRSLRTARATDTYILAGDDEVTLEPAFTFHGFQYAEVRTPAEVVDAQFVAVTSAWETRSTFECSDPDLNRLHESVAWSLRDNFVSLPTDCPQRDERLGWTGDAQVFAATAATMFWSDALWTSWLRDLELEQDDDLGVPSVVPNVVLRGEPRFGRAGWGDAATIVPWSLYQSYGDTGILRRQFGSMRRWVRSLEGRRQENGLLGVEMQFGDWLDPAAPVDRPWEATTDSEYLANAFFVYSARLLARSAAVLGEPDVERPAARLADEVARRTWAAWSERAVTTQTGCALALIAEVAPPDQRSRVAAALADHVRAADGHIATGFLGTPLVLPALSSHGYVDEAYQMLLCRTYPSWLYQVSKGATTVWERWDAIRPDGSIHPGDMRTLPDSLGAEVSESNMLSFNHYAYGSVMDWVYRHVGGIAPDPGTPGYRHILMSPAPTRSITWAHATLDTSFGLIRSSWRVTDARVLEASVDVPAGTTATFRGPTTRDSSVTVDGTATQSPVRLTAGPHRIVVTACRVSPF